MNYVEVQVWQDGTMVASVSGPWAMAYREAAHYAWVYGQNGPVEVVEVGNEDP